MTDNHHGEPQQWLATVEADVLARRLGFLDNPTASDMIVKEFRRIHGLAIKRGNRQPDKAERLAEALALMLNLADCHFNAGVPVSDWNRTEAAKTARAALKSYRTAEHKEPA